MYWIIVGDIHESIGALRGIPGIGAAEALILGGDLTNRGGSAQAEGVLRAAQAANPHVLAQVGNMDHPSLTDVLAARGMNLHREVRLLAPGLALMGVGWSTPTPFDTPAETSEAELREWIRETHAKARALLAQDGPGGKLVAVIHTPPLNTRLDALASGAHVGSAAVREFVLEAQPEVFVCGHIHEAHGEDHLGRTHLLNPGLLSEGGYVRLELSGGRLTAALGGA